MKQLLKEAVKRIFNACGFKIYRRGSRRTTMTEVLDQVSRLGFEPQTVIDAGVAYGTFDLYKKFPNASHLLIEPLKEFEGVLKDISTKYKAKYGVAAAGAEPGTTTINVHPALTGSSILKESNPSLTDSIAREVPKVTVDGLCNERNLRGPYLIKVDVQGGELVVLDGARKVLQDTELVILEVSLFKFWVNSPELYEVVCYMKNQGFVVYDIFDCRYRPFDGALAHLDMAFVKENGQFRKYDSVYTDGGQCK